MSTEPVRVEFHLDRHAPLVGVLRSAVQFQAVQAGFEDKTSADFAKASEELCNETISKLSDANSGLDVTMECFPDRMEISFQHRGNAAPAVGLERFASADACEAEAGGINGVELLSRVDRVLYMAEDGKARTTLIKFLRSKG